MVTAALESPAHRTCSRSGRKLEPGERYAGAVFEELGKLVRRDTAIECWTGPPPGTVAHWLGKVPATAAKRKPELNEGILFDCLDHLAGADDAGKIAFRYVAALLLMRKKKLKFEDATRTERAEILILKDSRTGKRIEVIDPHMVESEIEAVQDEVFRILGWE